jgi:hypothetical protein
MKLFVHSAEKVTCLYLSLLLTIVSFVTVMAQDTRKEKQASKITQVKAWIETCNYDFVAQMALPMSGNARQLTSEYDVQVSKDTITSYLPYFGRAYSASLDPNDAGIKFISKDFIYKTTSRKKGGWDIQIKPKDVKEVEQMSFSISEEGYASLQVIQTNRQSISFNGYIRGKTVKKHK